MSGHPSRHGADDDILGLPSNWARVILGVALGVAGTLMVLKWTGKDDEVARAASNKLQDVRDTAHRKGNEIQNSWSR
ncbi:g2428 [Coccomyxa viridis]|uniref:G2428 protein n=1 Tax=Coccomyxa viridis TaxID=1274662 RepID=A0ABP1FQU0_9CHLO